MDYGSLHLENYWSISSGISIHIPIYIGSLSTRFYFYIEILLVDNYEPIALLGLFYQSF